MSRTAHHIRSSRLPDTRRPGRRISDPWRTVTITDLRYSASELRAAEAAGRRPIPKRSRFRVEFFTYLGAYGRGGAVAEDANFYERRERRRLRERALEIRRQADAATADAAEETDDFVIHPFHHRRGVLWNG
ncbi:hypothetical protein [Streptosporangium carneum]|uniref:Uncharacterized protein n=1 Tax=Streptosporangium carneum TaxID=47481 RepID=A0A9W6MGS9_9ACTN|nr:hypothetical protein [Streptosporangium carneum]GLK13243.1 hypothetical protein GCM10017600_66540 [Streptosporangium carneum]